MRAPLKALAVAGVTGALLLAPAGPTATSDAQAHPLGNFTVNHYDGITLRPDGIAVLAVLDTAELPTVQQQSSVDTDRDGSTSDTEGAAHAARECAERRDSTRAAVNGTEVALTVVSATAEFPIGDQGLPTTRVTCRFTAPVDLDGRSTVTFVDEFRTDRIGWREITAVGDGLRIEASDVPAVSSSQELRVYPGDLLRNPLDQRSARIELAPGAGTGAPPVALPLTGVDWLDSLMSSAERVLSGLATAPGLTPAVGILALVFAVVLGASHALMPGHGKTVMAAYLAGKQGTRRDAVVVGVAVTLTHTAGVLAFGLLLVAVAAFSPVEAMRWLGVISGLLVAGVGLVLLRTALVRLRRPMSLTRVEPPEALVGASVGAIAPRHGHSHGHGHGHGHGPDDAGWGRASLIGMGMAGGLVPSPTALLVLLGAINLGRTWFGIALVLCYGLGMAATLTAAGLLLVSVRDRLLHSPRTLVWRRRAGRLAVLLPTATAILVLVVGLGLTLRGLTGV